MSHKNLHEANRLSWNAATEAHNSHKVDQAGFLKKGGTTLFPEEIELLQEIDGKQLVHLQCNAGQDTLSLAMRGAVTTGVDISDTAIAFARTLSDESTIPATFVRADVMDWLADPENQDRFDVAFCSYGSICWISDLEQWARGIAQVLTANGRFVIVDFHPTSMMFNERFELTYGYFPGEESIEWDDGIHDYVAASGGALAPSGFQEGVQDFQNPHPVYEFQWHMGAIVSALIEAGLQIRKLVEYPYSNGAKLFDGMREEEGRRMYPPSNLPSMPLMYGIVAQKEA